MKSYVIRNRDIQERVAAYILALPLNVPVEIILREYHKRRSVEANARYWAILTQIADQVKDDQEKVYSPETWHKYFKAKFLGRDTILVDGDAVLVDRPSKDLNVQEFSDYMAQVEAWGVEHDVRFEAVDF